MVWLKIIKYFQLLQASAESDIIAEAVPELLKNMILVMNAQDVFINRQDLWQQTRQLLENFLPSLVLEVQRDMEQRRQQPAAAQSSIVAPSSITPSAIASPNSAPSSPIPTPENVQKQ